MNTKKTYFEIEAGAVITKLEGGELKFLTIHRAKMNDYTLPKGHPEENESLEQTAKREVFEETGHEVQIRDLIDSFEYEVKEPLNGEKIFIIRRVYFFSGTLKGSVVEANNPDLKEGRIVPEWLKYDDALKKFTYNTDKNLIKKVYFQNKNNYTEHIESVCNEVVEKINRSNLLDDNLLKFGLIGSVNDNEFSQEWSDLDFMFILKSDLLGNIKRNVIHELRKINTEISFKYPDLEISFLTHTYDDFEKYVAFDYLNHYKFTTFIIENDPVDFINYIESIIKDRNINSNIKVRYSVYHLRHFRFNLLRKVVSTSNNKSALKLIVDKLIETMILYMTYRGKTIKGKYHRLEEIKNTNIDENIKNIFNEALEKRKNWKNITVTIDDIEKWLEKFEEIINVILAVNLYTVPEELINNR
jgi:8-oxo-dGTP pyrophosphatase MutT (NUDIX family)